jgi:hypothetical protein
MAGAASRHLGWCCCCHTRNHPLKHDPELTPFAGCAYLQAYGGRSFKTLGLVLQRALLINWAMCIPITLLWTHSEKLLLLLGQQPGIAAGAAL